MRACGVCDAGKHEVYDKMCDGLVSIRRTMHAE
jgi:hypothetical protein